MKQAMLSVLILLSLLAGVLWHAGRVRRAADFHTQRLTLARQLADRGRWDAAEELTLQVWRDFQGQDAALRCRMRHSEIDQIHASLRETLEGLRLADPGLYNAANTRLICQLELLARAEELSLANVL